MANNKNTNPFEFMNSFANQENFTKYMKWMPSMDMTSISNFAKEGADAIAATSQLVSESLQSVAKRSADSFQKNTSEMFNTMKDAISAGDIGQMNNSQQNYLKSTIENNISNAKEILDITTKSSMDVLDIIGKNLTNNLAKTAEKHKQ